MVGHMTSVAIYTRLSHDASGAQTATRRQQSACEAFAELRGWTVVNVFEDVDLSAYKSSVVRPAYERMLSAIKERRVDGVVAWKLDRLVRRPAEFERFWSTCEDRNVFLASAMEPIDTSTDLGVALVRVLVAFASLESATIGVRLRAKMRERADSGVPHNPAPAFGYRRGWQELDVEQAALIREAADRVLKGESLRAVVLDWNSRGVKPVRAARWSNQALRDLLMSRRLVGERVHRGEVVAKGNWPAILDIETGRRVRDLLLDPDRRTSYPDGERHFLTGLLRCGKCGATLFRQRQVKGDLRVFACPAPPSGCSGIAVQIDRVSETVREAVFERLRLRGFGGRPAPSAVDGAALRHGLATYMASLERLAEDYFVDRHIGRAEYLEAVHSLEPALETEVAGSSTQRQQVSGVRSVPELRKRWPSLDYEAQSAIVRSEVDHVVVKPAAVQGRRFDPQRVHVAWRDTRSAGDRPRSWLTAREAAARLGCSRMAVYGLIRKGDVYADKVGSAWLVRTADIEAARRAAEERDRDSPL